MIEAGIKIYDFPAGVDGAEDWMRRRKPFAVVGSNVILGEEGGKRVRGRKYPWGTVNIENKVGIVCFVTKPRNKSVFVFVPTVLPFVDAKKGKNIY